MLDRLRDQASLRAMLCHAVAKLTLDRQGCWTLVFRLVTLRPGGVERKDFAVMENEAEAIGAEVIRTSQILCSQLGQVKARLK